MKYKNELIILTTMSLFFSFKYSSSMLENEAPQGGFPIITSNPPCSNISGNSSSQSNGLIL